jgi:(E)-4-hydroxy-3-methylbut-2-enyl-diphosphate synthase
MLEKQRPRRATRPVRVGPYVIGGDAPILVQSMTKTTRATSPPLAQIEQMVAAGCELARLAVPDVAAGVALGEIAKRVPNVPLVADIHFQYRLALMALDAGIAKLRLNPGNIGEPDKVREVVRKAQASGVPIRIGVNAGSLERRLLEKYGYPRRRRWSKARSTTSASWKSLDFATSSSRSASHVAHCDAYRLLAPQVDYPSTSASPRPARLRCTIKSSVGLGMLLAEGIGDTIRVSLATDPVEEARGRYDFEVARHPRPRRQRGCLSMRAARG